MRKQSSKKYFLLQSINVLAAMSYVLFEGPRLFLVPAPVVVVVAFVLFVLIFRLWRRAEVAEHQASLASHKTSQPWESQRP